MKLKVFYKGYLRQNKGYFIEILTKIKSKSMSNFRVILSEPDLLIPAMIDDGMVRVQKILRQQIYSHLITNQIENYSVCLPGS